MNVSSPIADIANALECLAACQQAYLTCTVCSDDCNFLIAEFPDFIQLTARGSKSVADWLSDGEIGTVKAGDGRAHAGVWTSYQAVSSELRYRLNQLSRKPIVASGHSRGGGHIQAAVFDLAGEYDIALIETFGGMRWADAALAAQYDKLFKDRTVRWVNALDPVPRLPVEFGYTHVGHEAYLTSAGTFALDPGLWELAEDDVIAARADILAGKLDILAYHHMENYQARLEALKLKEAA